MKQIAHQISSLVLAIIILLSTFSFTVDKHYCGNFLVSTSVFSEAKGCGMEMQKSISDDACEAIKKDCCKNEATYVKGNSTEQQAINQQVIEQLFFVAVYVKSFSSLFDEKTSSNFDSYHYKPPLIQKDIRVLFENFRI